MTRFRLLYSIFDRPVRCECRPGSESRVIRRHLVSSRNFQSGDVSAFSHQPVGEFRYQCTATYLTPYLRRIFNQRSKTGFSMSDILTHVFTEYAIRLPDGQLYQSDYSPSFDALQDPHEGVVPARYG